LIEKFHIIEEPFGVAPDDKRSLLNVVRMFSNNDNLVGESEDSASDAEPAGDLEDVKYMGKKGKKKSKIGGKREINPAKQRV